MKRILMVLVAMLALLAFAWFAGCSDDDDDGGGATGPTPGSPDDPQYQMVSDMIGEGFLDHDERILELGLNMMFLVPDKTDGNGLLKSMQPAQGPDSLSTTYEYSEADFWHIFNIYARYVEVDFETSDTLIYTGIDSLRFSNPLGYVRDPDSATGMETHAHFDVELYASGANAMIVSDASYTVTGVENVGLVISGIASDSLDGTFMDADTTCSVILTTDQTATDLVYDLFATYDCPSSGDINIGAHFDVACVMDTSLFSFENNWTVRFIFNGSDITVTYNNGTNIWTDTLDCSPIAR